MCGWNSVVRKGIGLKFLNYDVMVAGKFGSLEMPTMFWTSMLLWSEHFTGLFNQIRMTGNVSKMLDWFKNPIHFTMINVNMSNPKKEGI